MATQSQPLTASQKRLMKRIQRTCNQLYHELVELPILAISIFLGSFIFDIPILMLLISLVPLFGIFTIFITSKKMLVRRVRFLIRNYAKSDIDAVQNAIGPTSSISNQVMYAAHLDLMFRNQE